MNQRKYRIVIHFSKDLRSNTLRLYKVFENDKGEPPAQKLIFETFSWSQIAPDDPQTVCRLRNQLQNFIDELSIVEGKPLKFDLSSDDVLTWFGLDSGWL